MKTKTIQQLRQSGYKVRVLHRDWIGLDRERVDISRLARDKNPCVTQIDVTSPDGKNSTGYAFRATGDNYNRKLGNQIALGRALKNL